MDENIKVFLVEKTLEGEEISGVLLCKAVEQGKLTMNEARFFHQDLVWAVNPHPPDDKLVIFEGLEWRLKDG